MASTPSKPKPQIPEGEEPEVDELPGEARSPKTQPPVPAKKTASPIKGMPAAPIRVTPTVPPMSTPSTTGDGEESQEEEASEYPPDIMDDGEAPSNPSGDDEFEEW